MENITNELTLEEVTILATKVEKWNDAPEEGIYQGTLSITALTDDVYKYIINIMKVKYEKPTYKLTIRIKLSSGESVTNDREEPFIQIAELTDHSFEMLYKAAQKNVSDQKKNHRDSLIQATKYYLKRNQ
jgi:hypothetical protein